MRTNLKGFARNFANRKDWGGFWNIGSHVLNNEEAHLFVDKAIAAGFDCDEDVPEDLIRK